jgi:hypothetical protein
MSDERPADLLFWFKDGTCGGFQARVEADVEISIGRTNSKRALGFIIMHKKKKVFDFVLDRDQAAELAAFLQGSFSTAKAARPQTESTQSGCYELAKGAPS